MSEQISKTTDKGKVAAPAWTDHKGPTSGRPAAAVAGQQQHASGRAAATSHEDEKTAHSRRDRGWPSGALVEVSLASPLRPLEGGSPRR